eukprot:scaffold3159_cov191-Alexandrium_tamarense.AAC.30
MGTGDSRVVDGRPRASNGINPWQSGYGNTNDATAYRLVTKVDENALRRWRSCLRLFAALCVLQKCNNHSSLQGQRQTLDLRHILDVNSY